VREVRYLLALAAGAVLLGAVAALGMFGTGGDESSGQPSAPSGAHRRMGGVGNASGVDRRAPRRATRNPAVARRRLTQSPPPTSTPAASRPIPAPTAVPSPSTTARPAPSATREPSRADGPRPTKPSHAPGRRPPPS
jgi:hypothetical protein